MQLKKYVDNKYCYKLFEKFIIYLKYYEKNVFTFALNSNKRSH